MAVSAKQIICRPYDPLPWSRRLPYSGAMNDALEDSALMLRYCDGDVDAFDALYQRHNDALYRYLFRLCKHRDTAEDLYQEVWSKIIRSRQFYPDMLLIQDSRDIGPNRRL